MISVLILLVLTLVAYFIKRQYFYWDYSGISFVKASIPFGNLKTVAQKKRSFGLAIFDLYNSSKEQLLGIYLFFRPAVLVRDATLVKNMLTTDFSYFHDRGVYHNPKKDPMSGNLFSLEGEVWKNLRSKFTPAFTSGKLKGMLENITYVSENLVEFLKAYAEREEVIDIRDMAARYVADCLASIAFGQDGISCIENPNHEFRLNLKKLNEGSSLKDVTRRTAVFVCPNILKYLNMKSLPKFMRDFCINMVTKTTEQRESNNEVRKDLMQYFIQLRNNSANIDEWKIHNNSSVGKQAKTMSCEQIAANVFLFYVAGNDSSSLTIAYTIYELTQNEKLMQQAQDDIENTLVKFDGKLTYEAINDMKFIDLCIKETLRKYPALPILNRQCTKDYKIPDSDFVIKKGTPIIISLLGLHRDRKYFPDPMKYDPERFSKERNDYVEDAYLPFGIGPRNCIAFRMGLLISKIAVIKLLMNFKFKALRLKELEFDFKGVSLLPKEGTCLVSILQKK